MFCKHCGAQNDDGAQFCTKCGGALNDNVQASTNNVSGGQAVVKANSFNFLSYIINGIIKPIETFKGNKKELSEPKNAVILGAISAGIMTILALFKAIISAVYSPATSGIFGSSKSKWNWDNMKNVEYFNVIFKTLIITFIVFFVLAGIYYLAGMILKKKLDYFSLVSLIAASLIPAIVTTQFLGTIFTLFSMTLGLIISLIGIIYSVVVITVGINEEVKLESADLRVYFHAAIASVNMILIYIYVYNAIINSATSAITKIFS